MPAEVSEFWTGFLAQLIAIATAGWRIEEDHQLAKQSTGLDAGQVIRWKSWHRWTAICLLAYIYLTVAAAAQRQHEASHDLDAGLIPITDPEPLRLQRGIVIPPPAPRPPPPPALVHLATPPRASRPPSPPKMERLRRDNTMITTNYSRRLTGSPGPGRWGDAGLASPASEREGVAERDQARAALAGVHPLR